MRKYQFLNRITLLAFILLVSCKKDKSITSNGSNVSTSATFKLVLKSDAPLFIWDSLCNTNAAGNYYSVVHLKMYVSNITLKKENGSSLSFNKVYYLDPSDSLKNSIAIDALPKGNYTEMSFLLGLDSIHNIDYGLPSNLDNLNMAWPTAMGGGYHFLKMEGYFLDSLSVSNGYAIHLGTNHNLSRISINKQMVQEDGLHNYSLVFNINEVFVNPYLYDLNKEPVYTMSDSTAMYKIKTNIKDAFTIIQNN